MRTPIDDFVRAYAAKGTARLHMPGHKGVGDAEQFDITEIDGAVSIIGESEANASLLFGSPTLYSTEGSSHCIRAMLYLASLHASAAGKPFRVAAGRNAHKTFLSAVALLDAEVEWLLPEAEANYLSCPLTAEEVERRLRDDPPAALYLTTPDYLGNTVDVRGIAETCHRLGVLLLVDNAHGAYLRFLPESRHPIDLGADLCCSSAHKTLPVLTGGAYLHLSPALPMALREQAKAALELFGSTSPSYLIYASLDRANAYLAGGYREKLASFCREVECLKEELSSAGFTLCGDEPMKLTVAPKDYGYTGPQLSEYLQDRGLTPEFCDPDHLVLMLTPECDTAPIREALLSLPRRAPILTRPPAMSSLPHRALTPREAILSPSERLAATACVGRIIASLTVGCPPAVPVLASGERVETHHLSIFEYYGITELRVVKRADP